MFIMDNLTVIKLNKSIRGNDRQIIYEVRKSLSSLLRLHSHPVYMTLDELDVILNRNRNEWTNTPPAYVSSFSLYVFFR